MSMHFLSTVSPAPPGFTYAALSKRVLLSGSVALYTDRPEEVLTLVDRFTERVQGALVTVGSSFEQRQLGPWLWHMRIPGHLLPDLKGFLEHSLAILTQGVTLQERATEMERKLERAMGDQEVTRLDYNRVRSKLQDQVFELKAAQKALRESETRLRAIIEHTSDAIFIKSLDGRYLLINPAGAACVGRSVQEVLGKRDEELFTPETGAWIRARDQEVLAVGTLQTFEEPDLKTPDGTVRSYLTTKYPYRDAQGRIVGLIGISRDITMLKRAEEERAQLLVREQRALAEADVARQLNALTSAFINSVSHELRTPLTSIMGYAEFLEDRIEGELSLQQGEFVKQIQRGVRRLKHLVDDLLDAARLDAGTFKLTKQEADLSREVREIVESLRPQVEEAQVRLEVEVADEPLVARFDTQRVEQILINLLFNAIKFTPSGGEIRVRACREGDCLRCEVADTGIGIPPGDIPKLFQRFHQLEGGLRKTEGTGLGLSICKALVDAHGGAIGVESEPGKGSTFWFTLPSPEHGGSARATSALPSLARSMGGGPPTTYRSPRVPNSPR